ncbi:hypothetical protein SDJN02_01985, partial [Cucurbita argyrosperma subsp. argyrosperma]
MGFKLQISEPYVRRTSNPRPEIVRKQRAYKPRFEAHKEISNYQFRFRMLGRSRFLSFPMVIGAVIIGVVSGKAIFGPPLDEYWRKKLDEEANAKDSGTTTQVSIGQDSHV